MLCLWAWGWSWCALWGQPNPGRKWGDVPREQLAKHLWRFWRWFSRLMPPNEESVLREGCYSVCFFHDGIAALWMSFSVGGKTQDPSIIFHYFSRTEGVFILPWPEVCWCVWGASLAQGNIHLRSRSLMQVLRPSASSQFLEQQCPRSECDWSSRKDEQNKHMLFFNRDAKEDCAGGIWYQPGYCPLGEFFLSIVLACGMITGRYQNLPRWATTWKHVYCPREF